MMSPMGPGGGHLGGPLPPPSFPHGPQRGRPFLPDGAGGTLYVEGVPNDATVREICHVFRPFDGFESARLVPREGRGHLCFVEFTNAERAFDAKEVLQGYLMDRDDPNSSSLHIVFAKTQSNKGKPGGARRLPMQHGKEPPRGGRTSNEPAGRKNEVKGKGGKDNQGGR